MALSGLSSTEGLTFFVLTIIFLIVAISAVGLRIWAKNILRRAYEAHDFWILAALVGLCIVLLKRRRAKHISSCSRLATLSILS